MYPHKLEDGFLSYHQQKLREESSWLVIRPCVGRGLGLDCSGGVPTADESFRR
jgi:hypothetical protein